MRIPVVTAVGTLPPQAARIDETFAGAFNRIDRSVPVVAVEQARTGFSARYLWGHNIPP